MELKDILKTLKENKKLLLIGITIGILAGYSFFLLPQKYIASGSFYITRKTEEMSQEFFKYEGYYSQQAALSYTNTIAALFESLDITSKSLEKLNISTNEKNLRKYQKRINVVKAGPQLITLTVKEENFNLAKDFWNTLADTTINESLEMNKNGDTNLNVSKVSKEPVVKEAYKSLPLDIVLGGILGGVFSLLYAAVNEYLKEDKK